MDAYSQLSTEGLGHIFCSSVMLKLNNWIQRGYVKPDYVKDPRGGKERRIFSIFQIERIAIIAALVNGVGIKPSRAVEIINTREDYGDMVPTAMQKWLQWHYDLHQVTGAMARTWSTGLPLAEMILTLRRVAAEMEAEEARQKP